MLLTTLAVPPVRADAPRSAAVSGPAAMSGPAGEAVAGLRPGMRLPSGARLSEVRRVGHRTIDVTLDSPALGTAGHARILLPPNFAAWRTRRWPTLYLLHGCCEPIPGWTEWTVHTDVERQTARYDALVVMPDGGTHGFYSDWWNGGRHGAPAWERFHLTELRQLVELGLRGGPQRAIAGLSMGGFGALSYAARHPGAFRAVASFSGLADSVSGAQNVLAVLEAFGADPTALWGDPVAQARIWRRHNPYDLAARLRSTPLYISAGNGTPGPLDPPGQEADPLESWIDPMNRRFVDQARAHGVRVTANLYGPGTHTWPYWERELRRSLPMLMGAVGAHRAG
ncbi:alpha/beta hydrolase family protein [Actinomadura alba]